MPHCFVVTCDNYYGKTKAKKKVIYHMIPSNLVLSRKWVRACGRKASETFPYYARVCSDHFSEKCYHRDLQHELLGLPLRRKLKPDAVPDQNLPQHHNKKIEKILAAALLEISADDNKKSVNKESIKGEKKDVTSPAKRKRELVTPLNNKRETVIQDNFKTIPAMLMGLDTKPSLAKTVRIGDFQEMSEIEILARNPAFFTPTKSSTKIFDFHKFEKGAKICPENPNQFNPGANQEEKHRPKVSKLPMRSSYRIAKKKSIETLSDSFTEKINSKGNFFHRPEKFSDKLKFMAKLQLKYERKENFVALPQYDLKTTLDKMIEEEYSKSKSNYERDVQHELLGLPTRARLKKGAIPDLNLPRDFLKEEKQGFYSEFAVLYAVGLVPANKTGDSGGVPDNRKKMQIMEEVKEGSETNPPSSPGHAEQGQIEFCVEEIKTEKMMENGNSEVVAEQQNSIVNEEVVIKDEHSEKECEEELENRIEDNSSNQSSSSENSNKRVHENGETPVKRLRTDIDENYTTRDKIMNELIEMADCDSTEQIQTFSEQVLSEIRTLNELIKEKEQEWNHLLHMKKLKEELLIRLQRRKQTVMFSETDQNDLHLEINGQGLLKSNQKANMLRELRAANLEKLKQRNLVLQNLQTAFPQKPMLDVQSIIAEYRQRHPENVPRRGRRIRQSQLDGKSGNLNQRSALETPLESRLPCNLNGSLDDSQSSLQGSGNCTGAELRHYKDMLSQVGKLTQAEKSELQRQLQNAVKPPPPYPEVTVHPVTSTSSVAPTNSLLHGILTKGPLRQNIPNGSSLAAISDEKINFSPTLARLLTAPEKAGGNLITSTPNLLLGTSLANQSTPISVPEIFPGSIKARNEITITPLGSEFGMETKTETVEDESEPDRLIIDEPNETTRSKEETRSEDGEEVPQCQGCNHKSAQFVCAGCGNQWYCSRECQVTAWDDHSEVCSG